MVKPTKVITGVAALAAFAIGGTALAQSATGKVAPKVSAAESTTGPDTDKVQSGDQTAPDTVVKSAKRVKIAQTGTEAPGTEGTTETTGTETGTEAPASETGPSDGHGGHADEPGNPNANNQFEGQQ